jgi:hypothetical protein
LPDYSEEDKARMLARAQRLAEPHPTHSISPDTDGAWECDCGAEGGDVFDLASHFNEAAHLTMRDDPVAIIDKHIPSITDEMDEDPDMLPKDDIGDYCGDQRKCACGRHIDGYYDFMDHLKEVLA